jgi:thermostable 8-oxoguanine DNA glycosylase
MMCEDFRHGWVVLDRPLRENMATPAKCLTPRRVVLVLCFGAMVDPWNITNYGRTSSELEELILFCVAVAGKTAGVIAQALDEFLVSHAGTTPFDKIRRLASRGRLLPAIRNSRLGKHMRLTKAFAELARSNINLKACSCKDLEAIYGIGPKTARFFILHTRPDQQLAALDTHILRYMRELGYPNMPRSTPTGQRYLQIEQDFIKLARRRRRDIAEFDLWIWRQYARAAKVS